MEIKELNLKTCLSSIEFDPSPHRTDPSETPVSERQNLPIIYTCDNCNYQVSFGIENFKNHHHSKSSNLKDIDKEAFSVYSIKEGQESFLDFYCPKCNQPTIIVFFSGYSGYWGEFFFKIYKVLVLKK